MPLADTPQPQELRLKGSSAGKDYIGPAGETPGPQDREIVSFDGRVLILKYVDPRSTAVTALVCSCVARRGRERIL